MYSTCLFCHAALGENESIEAFPVGRKFAFDTARGRLWVICVKCGGWNLTPLEARWEAVEECERRSRTAAVRASAGEITLAALPDGTKLVRVGAAGGAEVAAWRYDGEFSREAEIWRWQRIVWRRRGALALRRTSTLGAAAAMGAALATGAWWPVLGAVPVMAAGLEFARRRPQRVIARVDDGDGTVRAVTRRIAAATQLVESTGHPIELVLPDEVGALRLVGEEAVYALGLWLPHLNRPFRWAHVRLALDVLHKTEGMRARFEGTHKPPTNPIRARRPLGRGDMLWLEMAAQAEVERRAMAGELARLERAWREAEEIASIADDLLLPDAVCAKLASNGR